MLYLEARVPNNPRESAIETGPTDGTRMPDCELGDEAPPQMASVDVESTWTPLDEGELK